MAGTYVFKFELDVFRFMGAWSMLAESSEMVICSQIRNQTRPSDPPCVKLIRLVPRYPSSLLYNRHCDTPTASPDTAAMKIKKSRVSKSPVLADDSNGELYNVDVMSTSEKAISSSSHTVSDDGAWEDEPEINLARPDEKSPSPPSRSVRKRKVGSRTIFVAQPNSSRKVPSAKAKNIAADVPPLFDIDREQLRDAFRSGGSYALEYAFDVVKTAIQFLRKPLSFFLFIWLLSLIFSQIHGFLRTIVSPVCWIPGVSRTPLCYTPAPPPRVPKWADYPKLVEMEGSTFEQLLDESVGGSGLSLEIKRAEMATSDLVTLVKVSSLRSKDRMAQYLEEFVADAKTTGRGLQKLSSRIGGAVDRYVLGIQTLDADQD